MSRLSRKILAEELQRPKPQGSGRLEGRIALVTGASRGIGAAVAERFAAEGAQLILLARTKGALEEMDDRVRSLGAPRATLVPLDLRDFDALDRLGASLFERHGRLDVFVGNAGVLGTLSPLGHVSPQVWQEVMDVNVTANWRLIRSLDLLLRRSEAGRAIFLTSGASRSAHAYWGPYAVSKAALDMLVLTYAAETAKSPLRVNLVNPGPTRTTMRAQAFPQEDSSRLPPPEAITDLMVELAEAACTRHGETIDFLPPEGRG